MDGDVAPLHPAKLHGHRHGGQRLALALPGNTWGLWSRAGHGLENFHRARRQGNAVGMARLHADGGNGPDGLVEVKLAPLGIEDFAGTGGGEDGKFQGQRGGGFPRPEFGHEGGEVIIGQRRMMASGEPLAGREKGFEVAAPCGGVLAIAEAPRLGCVENVLNPAPQP